MTFMIGIIMMVVAVSLLLYTVISMVGVKEALLIIAVAIFVTGWVALSGVLIIAGI